MKLIVCLDNKNGMAFNGRRQSRDAKVCERIAALAENSVLWMNAYSAKLFPAPQDRIRIAEDFLDAAGAGEYCFLEDRDAIPWLAAAQEVWVFRWNRDYPSDLKFPMEQLESRLHRVLTEEFPGNSHPLITLEVYRP